VSHWFFNLGEDEDQYTHVLAIAGEREGSALIVNMIK